MARDSWRPAVTLSVAEDDVAPEDLVPILLVDVAQDVCRPQAPVKPARPERRTR